MLAELRLITVDYQDRFNDLSDEVEEISTQLENKTEDRFYGSDFERFLEANPQLNRPVENSEGHDG